VRGQRSGTQSALARWRCSGLLVQAFAWVEQSLRSPTSTEPRASPGPSTISRTQCRPRKTRPPGYAVQSSGQSPVDWTSTAPALLLLRGCVHPAILTALVKLVGTRTTTCSLPRTNSAVFANHGSLPSDRCDSSPAPSGLCGSRPIARPRWHRPRPCRGPRRCTGPRHSRLAPRARPRRRHHRRRPRAAPPIPRLPAPRCASQAAVRVANGAAAAAPDAQARRRTTTSPRPTEPPHGTYWLSRRSDEHCGGWPIGRCRHAKSTASYSRRSRGTSGLWIGTGGSSPSSGSISPQREERR
jgi:hypothetical protein